ncbi:TetR/AcrR family transcriptional regulator [Lentzea sp. NPDC051838]|uniref:TetR/AcrR family transcriptional regulator n=1 Tax=Lentzea sp. NPDC051838 TaxID=3154849 RepID=UPI00342A44AC
MKRGRKPAIDAADITRAAIAVADAEGLAAVSMARVAQELGNATMALYRHVKSKDELLALMSDSAMEDPPDLPEGDWRERLRFWAKAVLAGIGRHPWFPQVPISPPVGPHSLAWFDKGLGALDGTPLEPDEKAGVVLTLMTYVHGEARSLTPGYEDGLAARFDFGLHLFLEGVAAHIGGRT